MQRSASHMPNWCLWSVDGGQIAVHRDELLVALEAAYDPFNPNWPAMVEIDE